MFRWFNLSRLIEKGFRTLREEGFSTFTKKASRYMFRRTINSCKVQFRRLRYNYHLKNWTERKRNILALREARKKWKKANNPLVSVLIPTYNRGEVLVNRAIASVLRQTYQNFEIIVVGDHCTDNTERLLLEVGDERIKFFNLPQRGNYPKISLDRWMVAGVVPRNFAIEWASGDWIAPLDDDDEFTPDHIEVLLNFALENDYEFVYGVTEMEISPDRWIKVGSYPLQHAKICHSAVMYHSILKFFRYDINSWKYYEPADWNMWRRMKEAGVRIGFLDKIVAKHYLERTKCGV